MIYYLVKSRHARSIFPLLTSATPQLRKIMKVVYYEDLESMRSLNFGTYIFSDICRLDRVDAERATLIWNKLRSEIPDARLLNHPTASMKRYELLRTLYQIGLNPYNVYRLTERRIPQRYPVFVREEDVPTKPHERVDLIHSPVELEAVVSAILAQGRYRENMIIVEFADTSDERKRFKKYSAFVIDGRIVPDHIHFDNSWHVKTSVIVERQTQEEQRDYVTRNPHEESLRKICAEARIGYGRIDYGVKDEQLVVWEIATNPAMFYQLRDPETLDRTVKMFTEVNLAATPVGRVMNPIYRNPSVRLVRSIIKKYPDPVRTLGNRVVPSRYRKRLSRFLANDIKW